MFLIICARAALGGVSNEAAEGWVNIRRIQGENTGCGDATSVCGLCSVQRALRGDKHGSTRENQVSEDNL